jgi:hypothetical protein
MDTPLWSHTVTLAEISRGLTPVELTADAATRVAIARELGLERLDSFTARVRARPWLDGAEIRGSLTAEVTQICSLTGEPFEQTRAARPPLSPNRWRSTSTRRATIRPTS